MGKTAPDFLCLDMAVSGGKTGNKIRLTHLIGVPAYGSAPLHASPVPAPAGGRAGRVVLGRVVPQLRQSMHRDAQSAGNGQNQTGALSGQFKLIRLQLWGCQNAQEQGSWSVLFLKRLQKGFLLCSSP